MSKQKVNCAKGTREADLGHAVLSASGSHRWLNCTPSARLELEFENTTSEAAREGTAAHALCEHKLKKFLKKRSKRPVSDYNSDEMEECTDAYAEFVMEQYEEAKKSCKDPVILIEQKLDFSCYVPEGFGTGDCIIISDDKLHIIDFKYGQGIFVRSGTQPLDDAICTWNIRNLRCPLRYQRSFYDYLLAKKGKCQYMDYSD